MDQLYQERILGFARATRGMAPLDEHTHEASVSNPTCGDRVDIRLKIENGTVIAASAAIRGCALCEAGAGLLTQIALQRQQQELEHMRDALVAWLAGADDAEHVSGALECDAQRGEARAHLHGGRDVWA